MWAAEVATAGSGPNEALIYAVGSFLGIVVTTIGVIVVQALKSRTDRTAPAPPAADATMAERVAVLEFRARDSDERFDVADRAIDGLEDRVERLERFHDHNDPGWRATT